MKRILFTIIILSALSNACQNQLVRSQGVQSKQAPSNSISSNAATADAQAEQDFWPFFPKFYSKDDSLTYSELTVRKILVKKTYDEDSPEADIYDVILEKNGKRLLTLEGGYYPLGNEMAFGLWSFLNDDKKQLAVSHVTHRSGRSWIVDLSQPPKVLFDSGDYDGFREEVYIDDLNSDGFYEISLPRYQPCRFEGLATSETPITLIIFGYDAKAGRFLPSNHKHAVTVKGRIVRDSVQELNFKTIIETFLELTLAGDEPGAWTFFDENYPVYQRSVKTSRSRNPNINGSMKDFDPVNATIEARKMLKQCLKEDSVYRSIRKQLRDN